MNEIKPSFGHVLRLWWSVIWRGLLVIIGANACGFLIGTVSAMTLTPAGAPPAVIQFIVVPLCILIFAGLSLIAVWSMLGKTYGSFRLVIVNKDVAK